ncbi:MAG: hypothetical protein AAGN35_13380 [Bacteroidota bacterium]
MPRRKRNRRAAGGQILRLGLPVLLLTAVVLLSPREGEGTTPERAAVAAPATLEAGRHYDWMVRDSVLQLMEQSDPGGVRVPRTLTKDSLSLLIPNERADAQTMRIFLNQRAPEDLAERVPAEAPFRIYRAGARHFTFSFATREDEGTVMVPMLYDVLAGLLNEAELDQKTAK